MLSLYKNRMVDGMENIILTDNQRQCVDHLAREIGTGTKHLSVVVSIGYGKGVISIYLTRSLITLGFEKIMVVYDRKTVNGLHDAYHCNASKKIDCLTFQDFIEKDSLAGYEVYIFHNLTKKSRKYISEHLSELSGATVSFFDPGQEKVNKEERKLLPPPVLNNSRAVPIACVYNTNELFDIRDISEATDADYACIRKEINTQTNFLESEKEKALQEQTELMARKKRLMAYIKAIEHQSLINEIAEKNAEIERLKTKLQADERDKTIEELKQRNSEYQTKLEETTAIIEQQTSMITFMQSTLQSMGISPDMIKEGFSKIQAVRELYKEGMESEDENTREVAIKNFQDRVAKIISKLVEPVVGKNWDYYERKLQLDLSQEVWKKLDEKSKLFLITALNNYDSMLKMPEVEQLDFSGVCLLVTKALEVECEIRFHKRFMNYLEKEYNSVSEWPLAMRKREGASYINEPLPDKDFTLGSVVPIVGMKREEQNGQTISYRRASWNQRHDFLDYAMDELYVVWDSDSLNDRIEDDYLFIEKVRLDYRNPAAHRGEIGIVSAEECLKYVIETENKLGKMLSAMQF